MWSHALNLALAEDSSAQGLLNSRLKDSIYHMHTEIYASYPIPAYRCFSYSAHKLFNTTLPSALSD